MNIKNQPFRIFRMLSIISVLAVIISSTISCRSVSVQSPVDFENASDKLDFIHFSDGGDGLAGAAWFDYNNDGFLDIYLTNGKGHKNGLLGNNGNGTFTNVSEQAGVENGMGNAGAIAGDIDNDGHVDLFLTGDGGVVGTGESPTTLYHNNGDGTFTDITEPAGVLTKELVLSAAFGDINNDGFLDIFIAGAGRIPDKTTTKNKLFLNEGGLTFKDISKSAGVDTARGGCAVGFCDYNNDGWIDIFNANCSEPSIKTTPIELFRNNGNKTFTEVTEEAGLDRGGFWMGITFGDYDNDGNMDIFSTNIGNIMGGRIRVLQGGGGQPLHELYRNNGDGTFTRRGSQTGVKKWEFGWGCSFLDFDNDGYQDLFFAGSFPPASFFVIGPEKGNPARLFINNQGKDFSNVIMEADKKPVNLSDQYTSGVAVADYDNNGFPDILVAVDTYNNNIGRPALFRNEGNDKNWLTVKTVGTVSNRDGIGARVKVTAGDLTQIKDVHAGSSFLSMNSPWLTFGLDKHEKADAVEVKWPSGKVDKLTDVPAKQIMTITEGETNASVKP